MRSRDAAARTEPALPNGLIIGAAKAGTTSLFHLLASHPQVFGSPVKEIGFFSNDERFDKGLDWYRNEYFAGAGEQPVRLEASPAYLTWSDKVAGRLRESYGHCPPKIIAILRDPVARAHSHYWHRVRLGHETLSFADALAQEDERLRANWQELSSAGNGRYGYFRAGCYATRLRPFFQHFDSRDVHVLLQEDLRPPHFQSTVTRLLAFLQIDDTIRLRPVHLNAPARARHDALAALYSRLKRTGLTQLYVSRVPAAARRILRGAVFPQTSYPPMDADLERQLRRRYADEVKACSAMIGRDLRAWLPS
jgi:Sulfotransferase domain